MTIDKIIQQVIQEQEERFNKIGVDITITNGNIFLRAFRIYEVNWSEGTLKGLTFQEEYAHARENREPVYCYLKLNEIKEIQVPELGLEYSAEGQLVRV